MGLRRHFRIKFAIVLHLNSRKFIRMDVDEICEPAQVTPA